MEQNETFVPINGQALCEYANARFGWLRVAKNGCGAIAVYNALGLAGQAIRFSKVIDCLDRWYKPRFFGVMPRGISKCLAKLGASYKRADSIEDLRSSLKHGGVALLTKWNACMTKWPSIFAGAHTMALTFDGVQMYTVYNRYSNRSCVYTYEALEEIIGQGTYMRAYIIS